jgi:ABC-type nitrate/sulfonate/bicarbonate transport system substrate-binding protein
MKLSEYGLRYSPGETLVANQSMIDDNPDLIRRFVKAMTDTIAWSMDHPDEAADAAKAAFPDAFNVDAARQGIELYKETIGPLIADGTLWATSDEQWQATIDLLEEVGSITDPLPPSAYYTNEFLP